MSEVQNKKVFFCFQFRTAAYFGGEKYCKVSEVQNKNMEYSYGLKYQTLPLMGATRLASGKYAAII